MAARKARPFDRPKRDRPVTVMVPLILNLGQGWKPSGSMQAQQKQVLPELDIWHCEALRMNPETLRLTPRIVRLLVSVPNVS